MPTRVVELEIDGSLRVDDLAGYAAVDLLVRRGRDPVTRIRRACEGDSLDLAAELEAWRECPGPGRRHREPSDVLPRVSVAVCTRDRPESLARLLTSLEAQDLVPHEILVIDNAPTTEDTRRVVANLPRVRYEQEPKPGLDFARNRALECATGEVIAYTDDDVRVDPGWVRSISEAFASSPGVGAVTGLILPLALETPAQELFERNGGYGRGCRHRVLPRDGDHRLGLRVPLVSDVLTIGNGCNMAIRVEVLRQLGGFDEALDTGPPLPGGGDLDALYRVARAGHDLVYEPRALVRHDHRGTLPELERQLLGHRRALAAFLVKSLLEARGTERLGIAGFLLWRTAKDGFRCAKGLFGLDPLSLTTLLRLAGAGVLGLGSLAASRRRIRALAAADQEEPARRSATRS